jgi:hypothetical protein
MKKFFTFLGQLIVFGLILAPGLIIVRLILAFASYGAAWAIDRLFHTAIAESVGIPLFWGLQGAVIAIAAFYIPRRLRPAFITAAIIAFIIGLGFGPTH